MPQLIMQQELVYLQNVFIKPVAHALLLVLVLKFHQQLVKPIVINKNLAVFISVDCVMMHQLHVLLP